MMIADDVTLLEEVKRFLNKHGEYLYIFEANEAANLGTKLEATRIHLDTMRWGNLMGTVISRGDEYVMIASYETVGDNEGDPEWDAWAVKPREVTTREWDRV